MNFIKKLNLICFYFFVAAEIITLQTAFFSAILIFLIFLNFKCRFQHSVIVW